MSPPVLEMDESNKRASVLIVDGSSQRRQRSSSLLERAGFRVFDAATPDVALRMLQELRPGIVLLGDQPHARQLLDLCVAFRRMPDDISLPVVVLTSQQDAGLRTAAFGAGADDVIADDVSEEELVVRVKRLSERRKHDHQSTEHEKLDAVYRASHTIRHGINNPLQVLELGLDLLREKSAGDAEAMDLLARMSSNVDRVRDLLDRLGRVAELKADPELNDPTILDVFAPEAKYIKRLRDRGVYRVLVVEDDAGQRLMTTAVLARSGRFQAQEAASAEEALEMARVEPPDVMLTDINMPGMSGFDLCARVKADPDLAHVVIIMLTVRQSLRDVMRCLELGASNYLLKPIDPLRLVEQVSRMLGRRGYAQLGTS